MADNIEKKVNIEFTTNAKTTEQQIGGLNGALTGVEKQVDKSTKGMLSAFKRLSANPYIAAIGIAITAVIAVFKKLQEAIKNNDSAGTSFARLFATLKAPLQIVNKLFDQLADILGKVADLYANFLQSLMPKKLREQAEAEDELVKATDRLEDAEREYTLNHAKRAKEIEELRAKSVENDKYSTEQRISFLSQALKAEADDLQERKRNLDEKIRLFEIEHRNEKSWSDETKNAYNELLIAKENADAEMLRSQRKLNSAMQPLLQSLINDAGDLAQSYDDIVVSIKNVYAETLKLNLTDALKGSADMIQDVVDGLDNIEKYLSDEKYDAVMEQRAKLLHGYYIQGVEGAKEVIEANKSLGEILGKEFPVLSVHIRNLDAEMSKTADIISDIEKAESEAIKKANENRTKALEAEKQRNKQRADEAAREAARVEDRILQLTKERLDEEYEKNESTYTALKILKIDYEQSVKKLNEDLSNAQINATKATTDAQRELYSRLIEEIAQKLTKLSTTYLQTVQNVMKKAVSDEDEFNAEFGAKLAKKVNEELNEKQSKALSKKLKQDAAERRDIFLAEMQDYINDAAEAEEQAIEQQRRDSELQKEYSIQLLDGFASIAGGIASAYQQEYENIVKGKEELTEDERSMAINALERQKKATIAQLALQQAVSIANAIVAATSAAAASSIAAPVVYAATAATLLGGIISSFVSANQAISNIDQQIDEVKKMPTKYATGGYVEGAGTATSDSIPARLSNGEAVINAKSTSLFYDLLSKINVAGGGVAFPNAQNSPILRFSSGGVANNSNQMVSALKEAIKDIQPVVSVKEITHMQNRIKIKER